MRALLISLVAFLGLAVTAPAQDAGGGAAIRNTIQRQLDAFSANDLDTAFGFAAPGIQGMFGTADRFGMMVRNGYPMVWRPGQVRFLELHPIDGRLWQKVMITDQDGAVHVLDYEMIATPDGIRIGAVQVLRQPDVVA